MFGNSDDLQTKTENKQSIEPCYGGFGSRFSYERCVRGGSTRRGIVRRVLFFAGITLLMLSFGLLCGTVLFRMVVSNSSLYFPSGSYVRGEKTGLEASERRSDGSVYYVSGSSTLASVTREESQRYRIPTGVMIKSINADSDGLFGLESGDIIVAVNGREVLDVESLNSAISEYTESDTANLTVFRDNDYVTVTMGMELCNFGAHSE